jgi:DNA-directed RNA polymerase subunit RPC12/RpoP
MPLHERRCWDCGNTAEHEDNIVPHVLCTKCGSQDTRVVRKPEPPSPLSPVERAKSLLVKVAAEMVRGEGMPSEFLEDWDLPKSTPASVRKAIVGQSLAAGNTAHGWARSLRTAIELLGSA